MGRRFQLANKEKTHFGRYDYNKKIELTPEEIEDALSQVKPDLESSMSVKVYEAFVASGCVPECHDCHRDIKILNWFAMHTIKENTTEMVCNDCFNRRLRRIAFNKRHGNRRAGYGCYIVNGKVVLELPIT